MNRKLQLIVTSSMLAAMTAIATMIIKVPTLGTNGYVNIGDSMVLISAWLLGNPYGAAAALVGSALADILSGYAVYAPGTAVIKGLMAFVCTLVFRAVQRHDLPKLFGYVLSSITAEIIMVCGYFIYEALVLGYGLAAAASIVSNAVQAVTCIILGTALISVLSKIRYFAAIREGQ